jgi:recombinational DNA repair ATPase RecF
MFDHSEQSEAFISQKSGYFVLQDDDTKRQDSHLRENDEIQSIDATMMLSRGETKMLLLALKQIEILFLSKTLDLPIVLLFDDLFAELDLSHVERLIEVFDASQVILSTQRELPR